MFVCCFFEFDFCGNDEGYGGFDEYDDWWVSLDGGVVLVVCVGEL